MGRAREAHFERDAIDDDVATAGLEQHSRRAALAAADRGEAGQAGADAADGRSWRAVSHTVCSSRLLTVPRGPLSRFSVARNCAACGWVGPAYTLSLRSICRPSVLWGSMPRTVCLMTRSGWRANRSPRATDFKPPG